MDVITFLVSYTEAALWKNPGKDIGHGDDIYLRYKRGEDVFGEINE